MKLFLLLFLSFTFSYALPFLSTSISGYVYDDKNHNSTKDDGEDGLGAKTYIKLCSDTDEFIKSVKVNKKTGYYSFDDVSSGDYKLIEDASNSHDCSTSKDTDGWISTTDNTITVSSSFFSLSDIENQNFGDFHGSKISGFVYEDTNKNGHFDKDSEKGISDVSLVIKRCGHIEFDSTKTASDGSYTFWVPVGVQGDNSVDDWIGVFETDPSGYISTEDEFNFGKGEQTEANSDADKDPNWLCFHGVGNIDFDDGGYELVGNNFGDIVSPPFSCSQEAYLFNGNNPSDAYTIDLSTGKYTKQQSNLNGFINATGYNVKDNFIWGYNISTHEIIKIDSNYNQISYKLSQIPDGSYYAGDVSLDGILYIKKHDDTKIYKIDLNSGTPSYDSYITISKSLNFGDFAFNPKNNMLYSIAENNGHLYKIDPSDGTLTDLGKIFNASDVDFHTFVFDKDGNLYFYGYQGKIYKIAISNKDYTAKLFVTTDLTKNGGDGTRCPNASVSQPTEGICYAIDPRSDYLYTTNVDPNASPLPQATRKKLDFSDVPAQYQDSLTGQSQAYNPDNGLIYRFREDDADPDNVHLYFYSIDPETAKVTFIKDMTGKIKSWTVGASFYGGYLYLVGKSREYKSTLYKLDPNDDWKIVSQVDIKDDADTDKNDNYVDVDSLAINKYGDAYVTDFREGEEIKHLFKLNLSTGKVQNIYDISNPIDLEGLSFAKDGNLYMSNSTANDFSTQDDDYIYKFDLSSGDRVKSAKVPENFDAYINGLSCNVEKSEQKPQNGECKSVFSSALSSTLDTITLSGTSMIQNNNNPLVTKKLSVGGMVLCDGGICSKTDTLAPAYDFVVDTGDGTDGVLNLLSSPSITSSKNYTTVMGGGTLNINGNIDIKFKNNLDLAGTSTINISGDVKIYADNINLSGTIIINISKGSKLTFIANNITLGSMVEVNGKGVLAMLSKGNITSMAPLTFKGLIYADGNVNLTATTLLTGSITSKSMNIAGASVIEYDSNLVDKFCNNNPQITINNITKPEGDSGTTNFVFTVTLDKTSDKNVTIIYETQDDSATVSDSDYESKSGSITILAGESSKTITIKVNGDNIEELDEKFFVKLTSATNATISNNTGVGTITNDDKLLFNAWDIDKSAQNPIISTKIVDDDINLTVGAVDEYEKLSKAKYPNIHIALYSGTTQLTKWRNREMNNYVDENVSFITNDFYQQYQHKAFKDVYVKIKYTNVQGKVLISSSTDHFAIRPDRFKLSVPAVVKAGESFALKIDALSKTGVIVSNYNETQNSTFKVDINDTKYGDNNLSLYGFSTAGYNFSSGSVNKTITYNEVGEINIKIFEDKDNYFANIDNEKSYITYNSAKTRFIPYKFDILYSMSDSNPIDKITFINDDNTVLDKISSKLNCIVTAVNKSGATTLRYTAGKYANDINITSYHTILAENPMNMTLIYQTPELKANNNSIKKINFPKNSTLNYSFDKSSNNFSNGRLTSVVYENFSRDATKAINPFKLNTTKIEVSEKYAIQGIKIKGSKANIAKTHFYYARAHVPTPQTVAGKVLKAPVYYEIYYNGNNKSNYNIQNWKPSIDSIYWYIIPSSTINNFPANTCSFSNLTTINSTIAIKESNSQIKVTTTITPYKDRVYYTPSSFLTYDKFGSILPKHSFDVYFTAKNSNWAGKGNLGSTVDTNISNNGLQSIEW